MEVKNEQVAVISGFPYVGFDKLRETLGCSKTFVYSLIRKGKITPKYLGRKPYFNLYELESALSFEPELED